MKHAKQILENLRPTPHPMRDFFRRNGVTYVMLARHCNCSVGWIGQLMAGYRPFPAQIAAKIFELAERIEPGAAGSMINSICKVSSKENARTV